MPRLHELVLSNSPALKSLLFYNKQELGISYRTTPGSSAWDLKRFLEGLPYWIHFSSDLKKSAKKNLIINAWTLARRSLPEHYIEKLLLELIPKEDDDYKLLIWQGYFLLEISNANHIAHIDFSLCNIISSETLLNEAYHEFALAADSIQIIGPLEFNKLLTLISNTNLFELVTLRTSFLLNFKAPWQIILQAVENISPFILEIDTFISESQLHKIHQLIQFAAITRPLHQTEEFCDTFDELILRHITTIYDQTNREKTIHLLIHTQALQSLEINLPENGIIETIIAIPPSLEDITFYANTAILDNQLIRQAHHWLTCITNLKQLSLESRYAGPILNNLPSSIKRTLKRLNLLNSLGVKSIDIQSFLSEASELESLYISFSTIQNIQGSFIGLAAGSLKKLKHLTLKNISLCPDELNSLFAAASNLISITISYIDSGGDFDRLTENSLLSLRTCKLEDIYINSLGISQLFLAAPNMETLVIDEDINIDPDITLVSHPMLFLKEVSLELTISFDHLIELAALTPKLEKLTIDNIEGDSEEFFEHLSNKYPNLKILEINETSFSKEQLYKFLQAAQNLEELTVHISPSEYSLSCLNKLPNLQNIYLLGAILTQSEFEEILTAAPYLKAISFANLILTDNTYFSTFKQYSRASLKYFSVKNLKLTTKQLIEIFTAAPFLQCMYFQELQKDEIDLTTLEVYFTHLISISSNFDEEIAEQTAGWLLEHAPKLEDSSVDDLRKILGLSPLGKSPKEISRETTLINPSTKIDGKIAYKKISYSVYRYFQPLVIDSPIAIPIIEPNLYRLHIYNGYLRSVDGSIEFCHELNLIFPTPPIEIFSDLEAIKLKAENLSMPGHDYLGEFNITLLPNQSLALPSISAQELLIGLCLPEDLVDSISIKYCLVSNQYYITNISDRKLTAIPLRFIVRVPPTLNLSHLLTDEMHELAEWINQFKKFTTASVNLAPGLTDDEIFRQIISNGQGSCRHRAKAFIWWVNQHLGQAGYGWLDNVQVRLSCSACHEIIEIKIEEEDWVAIDLGGYSCEIEELAPIKTSSTASPELPITTFTTPSSYALTTIFSSTCTKKLEQDEIETFLQTIVKNRETSTYLLELPQQTLLPIALILQKIALQFERPVYYINGLDDWQCCGPYLSFIDGSNYCSVNTRPGGPLYNFLQEARENHGLLIINWNNFPANKIASCHSVLDKHPTIQGIPIPNDMQVISLLASDNPETYHGSDFSGRHQQQLRLNISFSADYLMLPAVTPEEAEGFVIIDCHNSPLWKSYVLGTLQFAGTQLIFKEGLLISALQSGRPIIIRNGPWYLEEFTLFWQQLKTKGKLDYYGRELRIPEEFVLLREDKFSLQELYPEIIVNIGPVSNESSYDYCLNPSTYYQFLSGYQFREGLFEQTSGWLAERKITAAGEEDNVVNILVTRNLSFNQWSEILACAQLYNKKLHLLLAPNVIWPENFPLSPTLAAHLEIKPIFPHINTKIYLISGIDILNTEFTLSESQPDISLTLTENITLADLTYRLQSSSTESGYSFTETQSDIWSALISGQTVLLKGHISSELADGLASIILQGKIYYNGKFEIISGKLIIITSNSVNIKFCECYKIDYEKDSLTEPTMKRSSVSATPSSTSSPGLSDTERDGPRSKSLETEVLSFDLSETAAAEFEEKRFILFYNALSVSKGVVLSGQTSVGKSTFMNCMVNITTGYYVFKDLEAWINAPFSESDQFYILFIDEANLKGKSWLEFIDLNNNPPSILINGKIHYLSDKHRVVLACNPESYQAGRNDPEFFNYCVKVKFDSIPYANLYHKILLPLKPIHIEDKTWYYICQAWLLMLATINAKSETLTARELETVALLFRNKSAALSLTTAARTCAAASAGSADKDRLLLLQGICTFLSLYTSLFTQDQCHQLTVLIDRLFDFKQSDLNLDIDNLLDPLEIKILNEHGLFYCETHNQVYQLLKYFLMVRKENQTYNLETTSLGGIILEGEPGIGKSLLLRTFLESHGFIATNLASAEEERKVYYYLPMDMDYTEKERLLLQAYREGAPIIIDEINTDIMEHLLNDIIGTKHDRTDIASRPAPGFIIFGSMSLATMSGRKILSPALRHRLLTYKLPMYNETELQRLLQFKYPDLSPKLCALIITSFFTARNNPSIQIKPTLRDLEEIAKNPLRIFSALIAECENRISVLENTLNNLYALNQDRVINTDNLIYRHFKILGLLTRSNKLNADGKVLKDSGLLDKLFISLQNLLPSPPYCVHGFFPIPRSRQATPTPPEGILAPTLS